MFDIHYHPKVSKDNQSCGILQLFKFGFHYHSGIGYINRLIRIPRLLKSNIY